MTYHQEELGASTWSNRLIEAELEFYLQFKGIPEVAQSQATTTLVGTYAKSPPKDRVNLEPLNITVGVAETSDAGTYLKALAKAGTDALTANQSSIATAIGQNVIPSARQAAETALS